MEELLNKFKWAAIDYSTVLNMTGIEKERILERRNRMNEIKLEILNEFNKRST